MMRRFFVRVFSADPAGLVKLAGSGLDLFRATAVGARAGLQTVDQRSAAQPGSLAEGPADSIESLASTAYIDGLLTLEEIERLVVGGFRVLVNADADQRARAQTETIEFEAWLKGMEER
jgi:hypothetical protein